MFTVYLLNFSMLHYQGFSLLTNMMVLYLAFTIEQCRRRTTFRRVVYTRVRLNVLTLIEHSGSHSAIVSTDNANTLQLGLGDQFVLKVDLGAPNAVRTQAA